ncbi:MAG: hypothetical protein Ct9H90mP5_04970 [Acidimicrobiaceae bacterium]|nr:MAG: hypothetical protein Ct9H90mP5_04970 [Acidimicrobiaceae bacterium]
MEELRYAGITELAKWLLIVSTRSIKLTPLCNDKKPIKALVRVTPGVEAYTHKYVTTGQVDSSSVYCSEWPKPVRPLKGLSPRRN